MRTAKITQVQRLTHTHREPPGSGAIIQIITDLPAGQQNSFYINVADKTGMPVHLASDPDLSQVHDMQIMKVGDTVVFDKQKFLQKQVTWNGRAFKQRGDSFDIYSPSLYTG
jgi:hypothetical protein